MGRNLLLVERYVQGDPAKIDPFVAQLVAAKPDAILTSGTPLTSALLRATHTIPVLTTVWDPVESGFAKSLTASGRNVTGLAFPATAMFTKTLQIGREMLPAAKLPLFGMSLEGVRKGQLGVYQQYIRDEEKRTARVVVAILRGADPSTIPFEMPDSDHVAINRSTARKLGLVIPDALRLKVDLFVD